MQGAAAESAGMAKVFLKKVASLGQLFSCASKQPQNHTKTKNTKSAAGPKGRRLPQQQQPVFDAEFKLKYTVEKVIGRGGFGTVYAGYRNEDHKPVAIKVARKDRSLGWIEGADGKPIPREVWCLQRLTHIDGVIRLLDHYDQRARSGYILVMDRPDNGQDLFDYITERGSLEESEARDFIAQVVQLLLEVHEAGVLHRDVKDENIIVDLDSHRLKLVDFGSATQFKDTPYTDFDGTVVYSSPEWLLHRRYNAEPYTVWTLGILLYDMVCGNIPFHTVNGIIQASPSLHDRLSPEVRSLICRCLTANPDRRPTLQQILSDPWMTASSTSSTSTSSEPTDQDQLPETSPVRDTAAEDCLELRQLFDQTLVRDTASSESEVALRQKSILVEA
jgi:serine/threonine protein kinase